MREFVIDSTYILDTITYDRFVMYKIIDKLNAYISASLARWLKLLNESRGMQIMFAKTFGIKLNFVDNVFFISSR